jgi:glycosyltransferase involved in cell wall biosynthesis
MMNVVDLSAVEKSRSVDKPFAQPLISIVITHHNYSKHLKGAIQSILAQTHTNWECVVVDDFSNHDHRQEAVKIVDEINDKRVTILLSERNEGQVPTFFAGLARTSGEFVCPLDPDDRYMPTFLEDSLAAHLNLHVMTPIVCSDQVLVTQRGLIGSGQRFTMYEPAMTKRGAALEIPEGQKPSLFYFDASVPGWHYTSTSSMMFRRTAINYMKPQKTLLYKRCVDSYLARGCHLLGGTLFLGKALVYRMLHENNSFISDAIYASSQDKGRPDSTRWAKEIHHDVVEALLASQLPEEVKVRLEKVKYDPKRGRFDQIKRWGRSIKKRLPWQRAKRRPLATGGAKPAIPARQI